VDEKTYGCWKNIFLRDEKQPISDFVKPIDGYGIVKLNEQRKCPFLNQDKLCDLVVQFGDDVLSDTCKVFPREIHEFEDRVEYSLVSCCPEVVDILNSEKLVEFIGEKKEYEEDAFYRIRKLLIEILKDKAYTIPVALKIIFFILSSLYEEVELTDEVIKEFEQREVIDSIADRIHEISFDPNTTFVIRNDFFLDIAQNYRKHGIYLEYLEPIAKLSEEFAEKEESDIDILEPLERFEEQLAHYETLFRNYLITELFHNMLIPESDYESMVLMFQWITMCFAMMEHAVFLDWMLHGEKEIPYESLRNYIVIIARMTGYDVEDIYEYFEGSFEEIIWEWSYFGIIAGSKDL